MEKVGSFHGTWESKAYQTDVLRFNAEKNEDRTLVHFTFMVGSLQEALNPVRRIREWFASQGFCLAMNPSEPSECPTSLKWGKCGLAVAWGLSWPGMASLW